MAFNLFGNPAADLGLADDRAHLVAEGKISRVSLVGPFSPLAAYRGIVPPARKRGIRVLDEQVKSTRQTNFNNSSFLTISNHYLHDALHLIVARPGDYFASIRRVWSVTSRPPHRTSSCARTGRRSSHTSASSTVSSMSGALLAAAFAGASFAGYMFAIGYGLFHLVRLPRRRRSTGPREGALLFAWFTVVYLAVVEALSQVTENQRIRFLSDGLVIVLLAAFARDAFSYLATRSRVRERVTDRVGT
jgi:hypothetical protein